MPINEIDIAKHLKKGSLLFQNQSQFEERAQQLEMLRAIIQAYDKDQIAFIEAGTGVGKSLAYLLPALYNSIETGEKTVISTHTITLQEQLLHKDIPNILKALNLDVQVALVKGMGNYLCLRKLHDLIDSPSLSAAWDPHELVEMQEWSKSTTDGSLTDLKKLPKKLGWEKVNCESDACSFVKCPHYKECFFFQARKKCKDASLLIANHSLLLADLLSKDDDLQQGAILPEYERLILDEAHTFEDIASQALAQFFSFQTLLKKLHELVAEKSSVGKIQQLKAIFFEYPHDIDESLLQKISADLFAEKAITQSMALEAFSTLSEFLNENIPAKNSESTYEKINLSQELRSHPNFEKVQDSFLHLTKQLKNYATLLEITLEQCQEVKSFKTHKKLQNILVDTLAIAKFFGKMAATLTDFFKSNTIDHNIYVIEWDTSKAFSTIHLFIIHLKVADILAEKLFLPRYSTVLCSATLSHANHFKFIQNQLGFESPLLKEKPYIEKILSSPFDYSKQVLLAIPSHIPDPRAPTYLKEICDHILNALKITKGGAFILFTSYKLLDQCYRILQASLEEANLITLKQGDESRNTLLELFKGHPNAVLFGTDTFWEGIDVPGFHLRLVMITKLPFPVPSEPIVQAKCKEIEERGGNSFMDYFVPKALVKFKQGFGRLIRTQSDYGAIFCLDSRLLTKSYGKIFIDSLPKCNLVIGDNKKIMDKLEQFFQDKLELSFKS